MADNYNFGKILDEAVRIKNDYPELKYYEALEKAKQTLGFKGVGENDKRRGY